MAPQSRQTHVPLATHIANFGMRVRSSGTYAVLAVVPCVFSFAKNYLAWARPIWHKVGSSCKLWDDVDLVPLFGKGGSTMFFVTFHGTIANIYAYDDDGNLHSPKDPGVLDSRCQHPAELRTIYVDPGGLLFVVDEPGGMVRVYDPATGTPILNSNVLSSPVQILMSGSTFYVGAGNQVFSCPVPTTPITSSSTLTFDGTPALSNL